MENRHSGKPKRVGPKEFIVVATDYFTKWVEAKALIKIRDTKMISFIWRHILFTFGMLREIQTDNGPQFILKRFQDYCTEMEIWLQYSTPHYPEANELDESPNETIINMVKRRLESHKLKWVEELLPVVLWVYHTTKKTTTGESPFVLAYGEEVVALLEIDEGSARVEFFTKRENYVSRIGEVEFLDERRDEATWEITKRQMQVERYYNRSVRLRGFKEGEIDLWRVFRVRKSSRRGNSVQHGKVLT